MKTLFYFYDNQVGGGAGAAGGGSTGSDAPAWPGMQSPHWPSAPAVAAMTGVPAATPAPITAHPDYSAYHQVFAGRTKIMASRYFYVPTF